MNLPYRKPSAAFVGASWVALFLGMLAFCIGQWNATLALSEKGFYCAVLMYGLFAAVSVQKSVRDRIEVFRSPTSTTVFRGSRWCCASC